MRKCALFSVAVLSVLSLMLPTQVVAQSAFVGGGITIPNGDYSDFGDGDGAKTGYMAMGGVSFPIGEGNLSVFGEGFYGMNDHEHEGDKTNLYGAMGGLLLGLAEEGEPGPYVFGQVGFMVHDYKSDDSPSEEGSETGLGFGGGAGYSVPLGSLTGWAEGRYMFGKFDDGNTTYFGILAGLSFPLGGDGG